jgi:hypothetical protein
MVRSIDSTTSECSYCSFTPSRRPRVSPYAMNEKRVTLALAASAGSGLRGFAMDSTVSAAPADCAPCAGSVFAVADKASTALAVTARTERQRRDRMQKTPGKGGASERTAVLAYPHAGAGAAAGLIFVHDL